MPLGIEARARRVVQRSLSALVGGLFVGVGLAFLTVAAWIVLEEARGAAFAAMVLGGVYVLIGGVILLVGARRPRYVPPPAAERGLSGLALAEAFIVGLDAGRRTGKRG